MNRKLKALGLALVAALALTAVTASTAGAQFTSTSTHTILQGAQEGNHVITAGAGFGGITCSTVSFSGTSASTNEASQTITPTYSGCKDSFGRIVDVDNSGLTFTFTKTGTSGGTPIGIAHWSGSVGLTVTVGGVAVCIMSLSGAFSTNGIAYHNLGGTSGRKLTFNITNLRNTTEGGFFNCGVSNGEHTEGTYTGTTVITGKDTGGSAVSISVD